MNKGIREAKNKVDTTIMFKIGMGPSEFRKICLDRIRFLRVKANLTNAQLSCILEKEDNYLSQLENGKNSLSLEVLIKVLTIFRLKPAQFFADKFFTGIENQTARLEQYKQIKNCLPQMQKLREQKRIAREQDKIDKMMYD